MIQAFRDTNAYARVLCPCVVTITSPGSSSSRPQARCRVSRQDGPAPEIDVPLS